MIVTFPDLETLTLGISTGTVSMDIAQAPAKFALDSQDRYWFECEESLPAKEKKELRQVGVSFKRSWKGCDGEKREIPHWLEAIPVERSAEVVITDRTNVIFEIAEPDLVTKLVNEMLRQKNDRQAFRWITRDDEQRTLLRVTGPPYFTLLRTLNEQHGANALRAFAESNPRVWTEVGYRHPFAESIQPDARQHVFIDHDAQWQYVPEDPFRDLYTVTEIDLPAGPEDAEPAEFEQRLSVPLKLIRGGSSDEVPELWVLGQSAIAHLESFVRNSSDAILARLAFAVADGAEEKFVLVRVRPGRGAPPVLPFDGIGTPYRSVLRINNLFVPMAKRVHPPLRRDAIRNTLAPDEKQIVWLEPHDETAFTPRSIPDRAFQPLTNWVDYVLDQHAAELQAWVKSSQFEFDSFVCGDGRPLLKPGEDKKQRSAKDKSDSKRVEQEKVSTKEEPDEEEEDALEIPVETKKKSTKKKATSMNVDQERLEQELREAEKAFLASEDSLDDASRFESWDALAELNQQLGRHNEAAICRAHRIWEDSSVDSAMYRTWLHGIVKSAGRKHAITNSDGRITMEEIDSVLQADSPIPVHVQQVAGFVIWNVFGGRDLAPLQSRLAELQQFVEKYESFLSVRAAWLTWIAFAQLAGGDTLQLARSRDRLLERLYQHGLTPDLELPAFLRSVGSPSADRFRQVKDRFLKLRTTVQEWSKRNLRTGAPTTYAYIDLIFSYGLARLGESTIAQELLDDASQRLTKSKDDVHTWLRHAYRHRIREAVEGQSMSDSLPDSSLEELDLLSKIDRYKVDRLREHSFILEPHEQLDPYHKWKRREEGSIQQALERLFDIFDRQKLRSEFKSLFGRKLGADDRARLLTTALELSPRLGEKQATEWLEQVDKTFEGAEDIVIQAELLENGLSIAAHYGHNVEAARLFDRLRNLMNSQSKVDIKVLEALESMLTQSFRGLRRLGMRDELAQLLESLSDLVRRTSKKKSADEPERLKMLLHLAGGWFYFGNDKGWPDIDRARTVLFKNPFEKEGHVGSMKQTQLAMAYLSAVGQAPLAEAMDRFEELFENLDGIHDSGTYNTHYSLKQLDIVETLIRTVVSDDFSVDKSTLRWMDEEEFLIRRRIHADMNRALDEA